MRNRRLPVMLLALATTGLLAAAPAVVTVRDKFNTNVIDTTLWQEHQYGAITLTPANSRLEFSAPAAAGDSHAGLNVKTWGADWRHDFQVSVDYRLSVANVTGIREVLIDIGLTLAGTYPETATGYEASIIRESDGLFLFVSRFNHGNFVTAHSTAITDTTGKLTINWDRSSDDMTVDDGHGHSVHMTGAWDRFGATKGNKPMLIDIGCSAYDGNKVIQTSRARIDNFFFHGVQRQRPT